MVSIDTYDGEREEAFPPQSVTLRLADEIDISRGDMLVHPQNQPRVGARFEAVVVWLSERPLDPGKSYLLKHTTQMVRAEIEKVISVTDPETLEPLPASHLALNDIGNVALRCHRPVFFDHYGKNRTTGNFILIDSISNDTVAAGMIGGLGRGMERDTDVGDDTGWEKTQVSAVERRARLGQSGVTLLLPSANRARALAFVVERQLFDLGHLAVVLEGAEASAAAACARAGLIAIALSPRVAEGSPLAVHISSGSSGGESLPISIADSEDLERAAASLVQRLASEKLLEG